MHSWERADKTSEARTKTPARNPAGFDVGVWQAGEGPTPGDP